MVSVSIGPQEGRMFCRWARPCGWAVVAWTSLVALMVCTPLQYPISVNNFNYTAPCLLVLILATWATWFFSARHWFQGPTPSICSSDAVKVSRSWLVLKLQQAHAFSPHSMQISGQAWCKRVEEVQGRKEVVCMQVVVYGCMHVGDKA